MRHDPKLAEASSEAVAIPPAAPKAHSIAETARLLGIGQASVFTLLRTGQLRKIKILGRTLITTAEIDRFIAERVAEAEAVQ